MKARDYLCCRIEPWIISGIRDNFPARDCLLLNRVMTVHFLMASGNVPMLEVQHLSIIVLNQRYNIPAMLGRPQGQHYFSV
jgi:hypothetical protein